MQADVIHTSELNLAELRLSDIRESRDNFPISLRELYNIHGLKYLMWAVNSINPKYDNLIYRFCVDCVESIEHLLVDERSLASLRAAKDYSEGRATRRQVMDTRLNAYSALLDTIDIDNINVRNSVSAVYHLTKLEPIHAIYCLENVIAANPENDYLYLELLFEYCRTGQRVNWREFFNEKESGLLKQRRPCILMGN